MRIALCAHRLALALQLLGSLLLNHVGGGQQLGIQRVAFR